MDQFHPTADVAIHAELQKNAQDNSRKTTDQPYHDWQVYLLRHGICQFASARSL
ncbi:MAG: hypothetical protein IPK77_07360 [Cellvibrio sp.]|nr:hypothetical protein [Cellvibrio sp.]